MKTKNADCMSDVVLALYNKSDSRTTYYVVLAISEETVQYPDEENVLCEFIS